MNYHLWLQDKAKGPFTLGQVRAMWNAGQLTGENVFSLNAGQEWHYLSDIVADLEPVPVPVAVAVPKIAPVVIEKSKANRIFAFILILLSMGIGTLVIVVGENAPPNPKILIEKLEKKNRELNNDAIQFQMVRAGMTKEEVLKALGPPDLIEGVRAETSKDIKETWNYKANYRGEGGYVCFGWDDLVNIISDKLDFKKTEYEKSFSDHYDLMISVHSSNNN